MNVAPHASAYQTVADKIAGIENTIRLFPSMKAGRKYNGGKLLLGTSFVKCSVEDNKDAASGATTDTAFNLEI